MTEDQDFSKLQGEIKDKLGEINTYDRLQLISRVRDLSNLLVSVYTGLSQFTVQSGIEELTIDEMKEIFKLICGTTTNSLDIVLFTKERMKKKKEEPKKEENKLEQSRSKINYLV